MELYLVKPQTDFLINYCLENEMNLMLSYWADKKLYPNKYKHVSQNLVDKNLPRGKVYMDSGAFSAWTRGVLLDVDEYIDFINTHGQLVDYFGQVDKIPLKLDTETVNQSAKESWENYLYMIGKVNQPEKITYTFHVGEPIEYLIEALKWGNENKHIMKLIALGGMVKKNKRTKEAFIERVLEQVNIYYPEVKVHLFGTTSDSYFLKFPVHSGDSSNYIQSGRTRILETPFGGIGFGRKKDKHHYDCLTPEAKQRLDKYLNEMDIKVEDLYVNYEHVMLGNIKYLQKYYFDNKVVKYKKNNRPQSTRLF